MYQSCPGETLLFQLLHRRQETVHLTLEDHVTPEWRSSTEVSSRLVNYGALPTTFLA